MAITYKRLWENLIDNDIKRTYIKRQASVQKFRENENVYIKIPQKHV